MENLRLNRDTFEHSDLRRSTIDHWRESNFSEKSMNQHRIFDAFTDDVVMKISDLKKKYPWMYPWQIRKRLLQNPDLINHNLPSIAGVEWILRFLSNYQQYTSIEFPQNNLSESSISNEYMSCSYKQDDSHIDVIDETKSVIPITFLTNDTVDRESVILSIDDPEIVCLNSDDALVRKPDSTLDRVVSKKVRRQRVNFTSDEVHILEKEFQRSHYPDHGQLAKLAKLLNGEVYRIQVWFANRRAKTRRLSKQNKSNVEKKTPFVLLSFPLGSSETESQRHLHSFSSSDNELMDMPERVSTSSLYIVNPPSNHQLSSKRVNNDSQYSFLP